MYKKLVLICIILFSSFLFLGCTGEDINKESITQSELSTDNKIDVNVGNTVKPISELTIDDIKAKYSGANSGKLINIYTCGTIYALVEYFFNESDGPCFDFYNLKTGDKDTLPIYTYHVRLDKIVSPNDIRFISDGTISLNNHRYFPEIIECLRGQEVTGFNGEFYQTKHPYYLPIDQGYEMGVKPNETIADIKISLKGIEVMFEPMKGYEGIFEAAYTTVPPTKTSYDKSKSEFTIEFQDTDIDSKLDLSKVSEQNHYINSVNIKKNGSNTIITVNLKDNAKYYTIDFSHLEPTTEDFPYLDFDFANDYKIE